MKNVNKLLIMVLTFGLVISGMVDVEAQRRSGAPAKVGGPTAHGPKGHGTKTHPKANAQTRQTANYSRHRGHVESGPRMIPGGHRHEAPKPVYHASTHTHSQSSYHTHSTKVVNTYYYGGRYRYHGNPHTRTKWYHCHTPWRYTARPAHRYVYFNDYNVYYDYHRDMYIYLSGGNWVFSAELPMCFRGLNLGTVGYVQLNYFGDDVVSFHRGVHVHIH